MRLATMQLDRRHFAAGLLLATTLPRTRVFAQPAAQPTVVVHEPTELAWILAGLSPLGRGGNAVRRDTPYWRAAEAWFAPWQQHPAVARLGADFNLPRLIGNAANYHFAEPTRLIRLPHARPLWGDAQGDLFGRHRRTIEAFANESRARLFLARERATLDAARDTLAAAADLADMQAWLEQEFTARLAPMQVYVSPVTGGWNFTNLDPLTPRLWVPAATAAPTSGYARMAIALGIFTEMDHNYVNPVTTRLGPAAFAFMTVAQGWATPEAAADYDSAELIVNEYMTFAAFVVYAQGRVGAEDFARIDALTRGMMRRRGFVRFEAFVDALMTARQAAPATLERLYPQVLQRLRS